MYGGAYFWHEEGIEMIEIVFILLGCIAISMCIIFGIETYVMVKKFIKLSKESKIKHVKKSIPLLIIVAIFTLLIILRMFTIITENAPLMQ